MQQLIDLGYVYVEKNANNRKLKGRNIYILLLQLHQNRAESIDTADKCCRETFDDSETYQQDNFWNNQKSKKTEDRVLRRKKVNTKESGKYINENLYEKLHIKELIEKYPKNKKELEIIYKVIVDMSKAQSISVSGIVRSHDVIMGMINELTEENIISVLATLLENKKEIRNRKAWIQACLFNSAFDDEDIVVKRVAYVEKMNTLLENAVCTIKGKPYAFIETSYIEEKNPQIHQKEREISSLCCKMSRVKLLGDLLSVQEYQDKINSIEIEINRLKGQFMQ